MEAWTIIYPDVFFHEGGECACLCAYMCNVHVCGVAHALDTNVCASSIMLGSWHSIIFQHWNSRHLPEVLLSGSISAWLGVHKHSSGIDCLCQINSFSFPGRVSDMCKMGKSLGL